MKRMLSTVLMTFLISAGLFAEKVVAEGRSFTRMGAFKIAVADKPVVIDGVELETYKITYENSGTSVLIAIDETKKCRRYITISDKLSVQYVCYPSHFGVEKLSHKYETVAPNTSEGNLMKTSYFHQKVLGSGGKDAVTCMLLIGAYFPELLKENS